MTTLSVSAFGATHPGHVREVNEDNFYFARPGENVEGERVAALGYLYIAADGVGGNRGGDHASRLAVERIPRYYYQGQNGSVVANLQQAVQKAGRDILVEARRNPERANMSCTVAAAVVYGGEVTVAHLGDARVYLLRQGRLRPLTRDHSWVQEQVDAHALTEEEAHNHEFRNVITKSLGSAEQPSPTVNTYPLQNGDRLLLCSDGLCGEAADAEIAAVLGRQSHVKRAVDGLIQLALNKGGSDNIAVVVAQVGKPRLVGAGSKLPAIYALLGILAVGLFIIFALSSPRAATSPPPTLIIGSPTSEVTEVSTQPGGEKGTPIVPTSTRQQMVAQTASPGPDSDAYAVVTATPQPEVTFAVSPPIPGATFTVPTSAPTSRTIQKPILISPLCDGNDHIFGADQLVLEWQWNGEWRDDDIWRIRISENKGPDSDNDNVLSVHSDTKGYEALISGTQDHWKFSMIPIFHEGQNIVDYQWEVALASGRIETVSEQGCFTISNLPPSPTEPPVTLTSTLPPSNTEPPPPLPTPTPAPEPTSTLPGDSGNENK